MDASSIASAGSRVANNEITAPRPAHIASGGLNVAPIQITEPISATTSTPAPQLGEDHRMISLDVLRDNDISDSMIHRAAEGANRALAYSSSEFRLSYSVHEDTNRVTVRVYDADTQEVIREIPPESKLDTLARILEVAGLLVNVTG
jgi:uncharacterized FlaG/YvyC family protein